MIYSNVKTRVMLGYGWLTIRQAQEALKNGRLEDAHRLLCQSGARGHKRSWEVLEQVGRGFIDRGLLHLRQDDPEAAWTDLRHAEQLGLADDPATLKLRQTLARLGLARVRVLLEAGEPGLAGEAIVLLRERSVRESDLQMLEEATREWVRARDLADRGEFTLAAQSAERLGRILPALAAVQRFLGELEKRREICATVLVQLHEAAGNGEWRKMMEQADQVLAVAPQQKEALKARARAWKAVEPSTIGMTSAPKAPAAAPPARNDRFLLWIDGVGGYLVCLNPRVTLGQATPEAPVDVPLFADLSRHHATLTRDAEGYILETSRAVQVNGKPAEKALLRPGDRLTLGGACQLLFHQPVAVSATARLDLASGHRLPLAVDGVILMADTLVLGPGSQVHVPMPDLKQQVVLFRMKDKLGIRCAGKFTIDGQSCQDRGELQIASRVSGEDFAFAVEPVGNQLASRGR